jgi:hypothetical protein
VAQINHSKSPWQELYELALVEPDRKKLAQLIIAAEEGIFRRVQELTNSEADEQERAAMTEAVEKLLIIKTEKLGWPGV